MNKISRKGFLKIAAAAAMSGVTAGALAACNAASSSTAASSGAAGSYTPGTYTGTAEGISSTVKVTMTFSDSAVTDRHLLWRQQNTLTSIFLLCRKQKSQKNGAYLPCMILQKVVSLAHSGKWEVVRMLVLILI